MRWISGLGYDKIRAMKFLVLPFIAISAMAAQNITLHPSTIPGVELTALQSQSPYGVALTNRTEHTIVGFTILWVHAAGSSENIAYTGLTMEQLSPEVSWVRSGQTVTRAPGAPLTGAGNVEILLDAVRFEDGRFAGPDSQHAYESAQAMAATRYSLAQAILSRQSAGESASSIVEGLQATPAQTFRPGVSFPVNSGGGRSSRSNPRLIAARFVLTYRSAGETALYDLARRYAQPPPKLYR
jgi:hypothetical protein